MMNRRNIIAAESIITIVSMVVYAVFRLWVLYTSLVRSTQLSDIVIIILFWLGETFILFHGIGYFITIFEAIRSYERPTITYADATSPKVDICVPVHDEPNDVVLRTLIACKYIDYPNFSIILVDGSQQERHSQNYRAMCKAHGITYYCVPSPRHGAKAGAMNALLREKIRSPYFVIFDADFRPNRDFLKVLVPQMQADPTVAFIQTPQYYGNIERSLVSRAAELQQSIFYEYLCEAKSTHGGVFMCGTNLIIRTSALRGVGGFDETSITEDFATSLRLLHAGWVGRYYNYTAAFGDGPLNLREYFRQQYRWARGTLGLFVERFSGFVLNPSMSWAQRWEFLLSGSYYFVGVCWFVLIILPPIYIFFRVPVYEAGPLAYALAYVPYAVLSFFLFFQTLFDRKYRGLDWIRAESLALLSVPVIAKASIDALLRRPVHFEKTRKSVRPTEIPWDVLGPQLFLILINVLAVAAGIWYIVHGGFSFALAINVFWAFFHGFLLLFLLLEIYGSTSRNTAH